MSTRVVTAGSTRILGPDWIVPRPESHRENTEAYALVTLLPAVGPKLTTRLPATSRCGRNERRTQYSASNCGHSIGSGGISKFCKSTHTLLQESQPNARKRGRDAGVNRKWHAPLPHRPPCLPMARVAGCTSLHDVHRTLSFAYCRWAYLHHDRLLRRQPRREPQAPIVLCSEVCANQSLCWRITHSDIAGAVLAAMPSTLHIANV